MATEIDFDALNKAFNDLTNKLSDLTPILTIISHFVRQKIDENFASGGRWDGTTDPNQIGLLSGGSLKWTPLKASTLTAYANSKVKRPNGEILHRSGVLHDSIEVMPQGKDTIRVSAGTPYSAIHQYGGVINHPGGTPYWVGKDKTPKYMSKSKAKELIQKGKTVKYTQPHTITVPPRPYLTLTQDDIDDILEIINNYFAMS